jgi:predicted helicase
MTSGRRDRLLLRFRNLSPRERGLLSNARCLGEGVDVPSIDGVAFIDPFSGIQPVSGGSAAPLLTLTT